MPPTVTNLTLASARATNSFSNGFILCQGVGGAIGYVPEELVELDELFERVRGFLFGPDLLPHETVASG